MQLLHFMSNVKSVVGLHVATQRKGKKRPPKKHIPDPQCVQTKVTKITSTRFYKHFFHLQAYTTDDGHFGQNI
jgi:hypothetical protein